VLGEGTAIAVSHPPALAESTQNEKVIDMFASFSFSALALPHHWKLKFWRCNDGSFSTGRFLKFCWGKDTSFAGGVAKNNTSLLGGLDVALVIAADAITDCDKRKFFFIEDISVICSKVQKSLCQAIIVLLLLNGVIQSRMPQVLFSIGNQKGLQFCVIKAAGECCSIE
jgi:hypothetical protein